MEVGDVRATISNIGESKFFLSLQTYIRIFISFVLKVPGNQVSRSFLTITNTNLFSTNSKLSDIKSELIEGGRATSSLSSDA
jgi:hypothetical protein